jgi:rare lipoprotein A
MASRAGIPGAVVMRIASVRRPPIVWRLRGLLATLIFALVVSGCASSVNYTPPAPAPPPPVVVALPPQPVVRAQPEHKTITIRASWYGPGLEGRKTATGERFSSSRMTAAAKGLPLGSRVVVTNLDNGRSATVRINDCGPFRHGRKLDLSKRAARKLGIIHRGSATVRIKVIQAPRGALTCES